MSDGLLGLDLIAAHMVGDYILQTDRMARDKLTDSLVRLCHCLLYACCLAVAATGRAHSVWGFLAFVLVNLVAHFITDSRRWASGDKWPPKSILIDQTIHLVTLAVTARLLCWG